MFNFLSKSCAPKPWGFPVVVPSTDNGLSFLRKPLRLLFIRDISNTSNEHPFAVSYLVNSCGLSLKSALLASKRLHFKTPHKPDSVIKFLKNHGFSQTQISKLVQKVPKLIVSNPEKTLLPKLEFLQSKSFSTPDLAQFLSKFPDLFLYSLENKIIPTFNFLSDFLKSEEKTVKIVRNCPSILGRATQMNRSIKILRDSGVSESNIDRFLRYWPLVLIKFSDKFASAVESVMKMGFDPLKSQFVVAVVVRSIVSKFDWEKKVDLYKKWGWSEKELFTAFGKYPWCMLASDDKIMAVMDFYVNKMGLKSSFVAEHSIMIGYSLEKRIIPRASTIQFLLSKGLVKTNPNQILRVINYSEGLFLKRFVNQFDEAPLLLKLYNEKLNLSK